MIKNQVSVWNKNAKEIYYVYLGKVYIWLVGIYVVVDFLAINSLELSHALAFACLQCAVTEWIHGTGVVVGWFMVK